MNPTYNMNLQVDPQPLEQACKETFEEAGEAREEGRVACIRDSL